MFIKSLQDTMLCYQIQVEHIISIIKIFAISIHSKLNNVF